MFEYSIAEMFGQMMNMPPVVLVWFIWLVVSTFIAPLFFLQHRPARVLMGWQLANATFLLSLWSMLGLVRLLSVSHLLFWVPAAWYLYRHRPAQWETHYAKWHNLALLTMVISLVLDVIEVIRYVAGDRGIVGV